LNDVRSGFSGNDVGSGFTGLNDVGSGFSRIVRRANGEIR
jgi:hypothetical protein